MTRLADYTLRNLFDAGGYTGNIYYTRIVRRRDSFVWDPTNQEMVDAGSITWSESTTLLDDADSTGVYPIVIDHVLPADTYDMVVYQQLGSADPANTDDVELQFEFRQGSIFGF